MQYRIFNGGLFEKKMRWDYDADRGILVVQNERIPVSKIADFKVNLPQYTFEVSHVDVTLIDGKKYKLVLKGKEAHDALIVQNLISCDKILSKPITPNSKSTVTRNQVADALTSNSQSASKSKDASVVGRAVAGQIIAGPAGAVVGALSAVDKNNKNKK